MDTLSLARFDRTLALPSGERLRLRPIRPDDEPRLSELYDRSSRDTRYQRFFTVMRRDRKSTRLNSSHDQISYAVFCLKKKQQPLALRILLEQLLDLGGAVVRGAVLEPVEAQRPVDVQVSGLHARHETHLACFRYLDID